MAVIRQQNWLSQQRVDLPHLRSLESAVAADFDVLAGRGMAGEKPLVLRGLTLSGIQSGAPAINLSVVTANALVFNVNATEAGTFLWVPESRTAELLNPVTNANIVGGWTSSAVNYVGLDFVRSADTTTTDLVQFLDANTLLETPKQVPLAKTLDYRIQITTIPFSTQSNIIPIAKVTLNSNGLITDVVDARPLMFRLGSGGDNPQRYSFFEGWSRKESFEALDNTRFAGGDKGIGSQKDWMDAVMTRMWEVGGGEFWYSATADRNVQLVTYGPPLPSGEYFDFDLGTSTLTWISLRVLFDNSTAFSASIQDGAAVLAPGQALYVDLDRTQFYAPNWVASTLYVEGEVAISGSAAWKAQAAGTSGPTAPVAPPAPIVNSTTFFDGAVTWVYIGPGTFGGLIPAVADLQSLSSGTPPGSRWVIAWRDGDQVFTRGWRYPVGTLFAPATTASQGVLKISRDYAGAAVSGLSTLNDPIAISDRGGIIEAVAGTNFVGLQVTGDGAGRGIEAYGGATDAEGIYGEGGGGADGIKGQGGVAGGRGVVGTGVGTGDGIQGYGGSSAGNGVSGLGGGTGSGVKGIGGSSGGIGVLGEGTSTSPGVRGNAASAALSGTPSSNTGIVGVGSGVNGYGVYGEAGGYGAGVYGQGGSNNGPGVSGLGGGTNGTGGVFNGNGSGVGVQATANGTGEGVYATGGGSNSGVFGQGGSSSGIGVYGQGGGSNGKGGYFYGVGTGHGVDAVSANGNGFNATVSGTGSGVNVQANGTGKGVSVTTIGGTAVDATSTSGGIGVKATTSTNTAVDATSTSGGIGVKATTSTNSAVQATSTSGLAIEAIGDSEFKKTAINTAVTARFTNGTTGSTSSDGFHVGLNSSNEAVVNMKENSAMRFYTNNTERMQLTAGGILYVGSAPIQAVCGTMKLLAATYASTGAIALSPGYTSINFGVPLNLNQITFDNGNNALVVPYTGTYEWSFSGTGYVTAIVPGGIDGFYLSVRRGASGAAPTVEAVNQHFFTSGSPTIQANEKMNLSCSGLVSLTAADAVGISFSAFTGNFTMTLSDPRFTLRMVTGP